MPPDLTWTYGDALRAIWARSSYERGYISNPFADPITGERGLARTVALLDRLGRPQGRFGIVHVAGSKGKGSTCAFIDAILRAAGYRTGRFTSPHLHAFRERIAVDGDAIEEAVFADLTRRVDDAARELESERPELGTVTTFELLTVMALDHFAGSDCRIAVVEVGLGGTYDATNVVDPLVSVITRLDLEHTAVLGDRIEQIAAAKAGIIKPGRPVIVSAQPDAALPVISAVAARQGSLVLVGDRDWRLIGDWQRFAAIGPWGTYHELATGLAGQHQMENAATAIAAVWSLSDPDVSVSETAIRAGLRAVRWPGRFEEVNLPAGPTIVIDGAHSPGSFAAFVATLNERYARRSATVVLGTSADKDAAVLARILAPMASVVIVTRSRNPRAADIQATVATVQTEGVMVETQPDVAAAMARAISLAGAEGLVVATGSLFVAAEAREALGLARPDPPVDRD